MKSLLGEGDAEFTPAEKAAVDFAGAITKTPQGVPDDVFAELRKHWSERQIVEITAAACLFNSFNRFNSAIGVDPTVYPGKLG